MNDLYLFDSELKKQYFASVICGLDEAGRGPLAGDVYAGAVIIPDGVEINGLDDSKKLSEKKREKLFQEITEKAVWAIGIATVEEIEKINILNAAMLAMKRAAEGLEKHPLFVKRPEFAAVDGNRLPPIDIPAQAIVKGDQKSACIAAASICAKVSRDHYMEEMAEKYPDWQFEKHKGYGTKLHYQMLDKFGESPIHRHSFLKKYYESRMFHVEHQDT